ncbi:MAG: hypothetical protein WAM21_03240 [Steroidobacteraceae bacterium]
MSKSLRKKLGAPPRPLRATRQEAPNEVRFPAAPTTFAAEERQLWRKLVRHYVLDEPAALALLASTLEAHARQRRCRESIDRVGELVKTAKGDIRAHPLLSHERDARAAWLSGLRALAILEVPE